jgi:hypothetical protein
LVRWRSPDDGCHAVDVARVRDRRGTCAFTEETMRKLLFGAVLMATAALQTGCIFSIWDTERDQRARQLIFSAESLRHIPRIWERIWMLDAPDFETPYRTHGGVI